MASRSFDTKVSYSLIGVSPEALKRIEKASARVIESCGRAFLLSREIKPLSLANSIALHTQSRFIVSEKYFLQ